MSSKVRYLVIYDSVNIVYFLATGEGGYVIARY